MTIDVVELIHNDHSLNDSVKIHMIGYFKGFEHAMMNLVTDGDIGFVNTWGDAFQEGYNAAVTILQRYDQ